MTTRHPFPRRLASPDRGPAPTRPPRLWPNLPPEPQTQIARLLAAMLRRIPAARGTTTRESPHADRGSH